MLAKKQGTLGLHYLMGEGAGKGFKVGTMSLQESDCVWAEWEKMWKTKE